MAFRFGTRPVVAPYPVPQCETPRPKRANGRAQAPRSGVVPQAPGCLHQLGLDAFGKGEHLPALRAVAVLGANCRRDARLACFRDALFWLAEERAGYENISRHDVTNSAARRMSLSISIAHSTWILSLSARKG